MKKRIVVEYGKISQISKDFKVLIKQLKDVVLDEPCSAKIIKQPIGDRGKCFYKITDPD